MAKETLRLTIGGLRIRTIRNFAEPEDLERAKKDRKRHLDKLRYQKLKEQIKAKARAWRLANRERVKEKKREWDQRNRKKRNAYFRRYWALHPERQEYLKRKSKEYRDRRQNGAGSNPG